MESLENAFEKAVQDEVFPGAIVVAKDKSGNLNYSKAFGKRSLAEGKNEPLKVDTIMTMASMTKLMTSIAAMQLVEQGKISLDDDVSHLLPDLAAQEILTGFNDAGKPILKKRQNPIKLVNLLTHSAGIGYDAFDPVLMKYRAWQGRNINTGATISERFTFPLTYEPGTSWAYGCGIDWAGRVVEIVTGETLESYMKKNIWEPLGIQNITFWPEKDPEMMENLAGMTARHPDTGGLIDTKNIFLFERQDCMGGQGSFANLQDYIKILHSLLKDDGVLLKKETAAKMFQPQLTKQSKAGLKTMMSIPAVLSMFVGDFPDNVQYDWGIGGILVEGDTQGRRKKGTLIWSGLPNLLWFIDREAGLCGVFGTQVIPPGDLKVEEMIKLFELKVNEKLVKGKL